MSAEISGGPMRPLRQRKKRRERFELLSAWYGDERAAVEMAAHTDRPRCVNELLTEVLNDDLKAQWGTLLQLRSRWSHLAGPCFSRFTFPESLKDGVLTLSVRHSALLLELKPSLDLFQQAVEKEIGPGLCREIRLVVGGALPR